jgi:hypothetical protein
LATCETSGVTASDNKPAAGLADFVKKYTSAAVTVGVKYGIPYEAILAQAYLESGGGKSKLTTQYNNFFGIKAGSKWTGPVANFKTQEDTGSGTVTVSASFRAYATPEAGFEGYGQFILKNSRYAKALNYPGDPYKYVAEIKAAGYATDGSYVQKLSNLLDGIIKAVKDNNLSKPSSEITKKGGTLGASVGDSSSASSSSSEVSCSSANSVSGTTIQKIVAIAKAENSKKPVEYDSNVMKYTNNTKEPWCADFVSWVYKEAGSSFTGGVSGGWRIPSASGMKAWFEKNGTYFSAGSTTPQPGDVAIFGPHHVSIVVAVNGNTMTTIGGNEGSNSDRVNMKQLKIQVGSSGLTGFGRLKNVSP